MADDLERAIAQAYDPMVSNQARTNAMTYLQSVVETNGGWRAFVSKLFETGDVQCALVCITALSEIVLHRYLALTTEERMELKQGLFTYMQNIAGPSTPQNFEQKLAVLVTYMFRHDYPTDWPGFFIDLASATLTTPSGLISSKENPMVQEDVNTLPSPYGVRMWCRVLMAIHEEVVSNDVARSSTEMAQSMALKDAMRDFAIVEVVDTWYNILAAFHELNRDATLETLQVMSVYVGWIDINLLVNDRYLPVFFKLVSMPDYLAATLDIFTSLMKKGMDRDPRAKIDLMQTLQIPRVLQQTARLIDEIAAPTTNGIEKLSSSNHTGNNSLLEIGSQLHENALENVAILVNVVGVELLDIYKLIGTEIQNDPELNKTTSFLLQSALESLWKYFDHEIDDVSRQLIEFVRNYLQFLRKIKKIQGVLSNDLREHLKIIIQILHHKMRYDESYNFDEQDEEEDEFENFRKTLGEQLRQIAKIEPELVLSYVEGMVLHIQEMSNPLDMDVALKFFWLCGEGVVDISVSSPTTSNFIQNFTNLVHSKIFDYEEPRVMISQFFECVVRYARLFTHDEAKELLLPLLNLWFSRHGILHNHPPTRAKRCTGFVTFVKSLKAQLQSVLSEIVHFLCEYASFRPDSFENVGYSEQIELLETMGILVGYDRNDQAKQKQYIDMLVWPLVENMNNIIQSKLYLNDTPQDQFHTKWLSYLIRAVGTFSKGFPLPPVQSSNPQNPSSSSPSVQGNRRPNTSASTTDTMAFFARVFDIVMDIMAALGHKEEIRSACVFYYRRMVVCLNSQFLLPFLPVITERMLSPLTIPNLNEYVILLIQLITTYGHELAEILDGQFLIINSKVGELISATEATVTPQSEEERELMEFKRQYYCLLFTVAHQCPAILVSSANMPQFQATIDTLLSGLINFPDPIIQKYSFSTFAVFVRLWLGEGNGPVPGLPEGFADTLLNVLYTSVIPLCFEVPYSNRFNLEDAKANEALAEMACLERYLFAAVGSNFEQYLINQLPLTSLQCTNDVVLQYLEGLHSGSTSKQWKKFKREFINYHKRNTYLLR